VGAVLAGEVGEKPLSAIARDAELEAAGLSRPFMARAVAREDRVDPALRVLRQAFDGCVRGLDREMPAWRKRRVGLALGTSSAMMESATRAFGKLERPELLLDATYFRPLGPLGQLGGVAFAPVTLVLAACTSSAVAMGLGMRWLEEDACDIALSGGFDAVSVFVAAGFEALKATSASPRPFRAGRDGMALGDGAAVLAFVRADKAEKKTLGYVAGFGASADAVHVTAPDRTGAGLARAARAALADARVAPSAIDLVSAHATATPFNDAAESRAIRSVLGEDARPVVHAFKAQIGHTLGAAGALESLACLDAFARGILPASAGSGTIDADAPARLLDRAERGQPMTALKLSSAFGGANVALVLTRDPPPPREVSRGPAFVSAAVHVDVELSSEALSDRTRIPPAALARTDLLVRLALTAVARLEDRLGSLAGAGIVVGHSFATIETNALFAARLREKGARMVEPRRFPYTSPNAVAGDCGVAFGLTGPGFAVGSGVHGGVEALAVAAQLVSARDADRVVVVATDEIGPVTAALLGQLGLPLFRSGATAVLVTRDPSAARARIGEIRLSSAPPPPSVPVRPGHTALLPLTQPDLPPALESASPWGGFAMVSLFPV
jgi:3-oxoacyl-[acyl-carrier-protein] synthase-1/3-oxoacyl-[acyl-carrier-protein] synthase II